MITVFDAIHDQAQPARVLENIYRALRPGGVLPDGRHQGVEPARGQRRRSVGAVPVHRLDDALHERVARARRRRAGHRAGAVSWRRRCSPMPASPTSRSTRSSRTRSTTTTSRGSRPRSREKAHNHWIRRLAMTTIDANSASKRNRLPQTNGNGLFVTDGGLETELVFHDGIDLPCFAAFPLLDDPRHPRPTAPLLRRLSRHRAQARRGLHRRDTHVARQPRLGVGSSGTRPSSSTPSTARRWRSQRRSGRLRRPTASPRW